MSINPTKSFDKDPTEVLDYTFNFSRTLKGDTISGFSLVVSGGIAQVGQTFSTATVTVWLSGGTAGTSYSVTCEIMTAGGRTITRTIQINVVQR